MGEVWGGLPFYCPSESTMTSGSAAQQQIIEHEAQKIKPSNHCSDLTALVGKSVMISIKHGGKLSNSRMA